MRVGLLTNLAGQRVWHRWLYSDLARLGHELVIVRPRQGSMVGYPAGLTLAFWLDPILFRLKGEHAFDPLPVSVIPERSGDEISDPQHSIDVLIDAGLDDDPKPASGRALRLLVNGAGSELAAVLALLGSSGVVVELEEGPHAEQAKPGIANRRVLTSSLDNVFSSVVELLVDRVTKGRDRKSSPSPPPATRTLQVSERPRATSPASFRYIAESLSRKIMNYLTRHLRTQQRWVVATRLCPGLGLAQGAWPATAAYTIVPDDGHRYYADPFLFEHNGRTNLFVEEYPYATQRGIISVAELDGSGTAGPFRPVLQQNAHLSYPFVFAHAGEIYMLPEACESGTVTLFRAVDYPDRWVADRELVNGVPGCDATIVSLDDGSYVMVLVSKRWLGTTWDNQRIFFASSPLGPWTEDQGGLVRIDSAVARPAGAAFARGEKLLRPAQNCSRSYGESMILLDICKPSGAAYREAPVATIKVVGADSLQSTHTYNKSSTVEAIDTCVERSLTQRVVLECAPIETDNARPSSALK